MKWIVLVFLLASFNVFASLEVEQFDAKGDVAALKGEFNDVVEGDKVKIFYESEGFCLAKVLRMSYAKKVLIVDVSSCARKVDIKVGLKAEVDLIASVETGNKVSTNGLPTLNESWYAYWGIGFAIPGYSNDLKDIKTATKNSGYDCLALTMDLFGFYWPLSGHKSILGFVINGTVEVFVSDSTEDEYGYDYDSGGIYQTTYSLSWMRFFGANVGDGFFLRGDVGPARIQVDLPNFDSKNNWGYGILFGGGYGIPAGTGARLLFNLNGAYRDAGDHQVTALGFSIGLLW